MRRYIESALRLKLRLAIAGLLVFGIALGALYVAKQGYSASATVWVEQPLYFTVTTNWNSYISPAANQQNVLESLISTRQFTLEVARRAGISMPTSVAEDQVVADIQRNTRIEANHEHLIKITYTSKTPQYCQAVVSQTIQLFTDQFNANRTRQAQVALQVYQGQRDSYQQQMDKSREAVAAFLQKNPDISTAANTAPNPQLLELQQQYEADRTRYDDIVSKIDRVTIDSKAASEVSADFFRLVDPPSAPDSLSTIRLLQSNSPLALGLALAALLALAVVGTWTDPTLHTVHDLRVGIATAEESGVAPVLVTTLPYLKPLGLARRQVTRQRSRSRGLGGPPAPPGRRVSAPATRPPAPTGARLATSRLDADMLSGADAQLAAPAGPAGSTPGGTTVSQAPAQVEPEPRPSSGAERPAFAEPATPGA